MPGQDVVSVIPHLVRGIAAPDFVLVGSCSLALQGIAVIPRDIDILTTPEGLERIDALLAPYRTRAPYFDDTEGRNSFRAFYEFEGIEVEVLGNVDNAYRASDFLNHRVLVERDGVEIPCLDLPAELAAYRGMGRADKVALIEAFLSA